MLSIDIGLQPTNRFVLGLDEFGELNKWDAREHLGKYKQIGVCPRVAH
jgi:nicotinic acid mononucleotide adenylyltransferase